MYVDDLDDVVFFYVTFFAFVVKTRIVSHFYWSLYRGIFEPRCEKTGLRGFRPGPTQTGPCSHRRRLEA